ncbi:MAG: DegT/DnrJ/EryC1/StrS family aminotransferase [Lentimicrobiaceae bacterium]|nr:DegT/DnrJ/EryC1/StrS family aminotransferase [Lentimicrobiaceae bacterium]
MENKYSLASPTWGQEEYDAMQKVISSGNFTMGKYVSEFEDVFAKRFDSKYSVMVNSGSSANLLAIAALFFRNSNPLTKGDEVIVPAVSWATTYYPLYQYGLKIKFVDIDPYTLNFHLDKLKDAISEKTRLIFAVNLLGNPNDFEKIYFLIKDKNITLIEDNCESMGAMFDGKMTGTFGLIGTFSSFFSHHISTMEGGMINTDDEEIYHILLCLRAHGWTRQLPEMNKITGKKNSNWFYESWNFVLPGYNVRPLELSGAIGIEQLKKLDDFIEARRKNAELFVRNFSTIDEIIIQKEIGKSSWFGFSLVMKPEINKDRDELVQLLVDNNIECRPIVSGNFTKNKVISFFNYEIHDELINAELIDKRGLFIGNHHYNLSGELDRTFNVVKKFFNN